ncbi:NFX1-type zinc finger-containing protein 1, partial [Coelomomyces lativittatus]
MDFDFDYGSCFSIWYLVPPYAKSTFQLKRFFENCLLRDGLVALVRAPSKECPEAQIYFATVVTKNDSVENIKHGYSTVLLNFAENRSQTAWLKYSREFVMVEVRGLLFEAYRPVLRALQQLEPSDIPFTSILCSATPLKKIDPPCYMRTGQFKCDLNFLKKDVKSEVNLVFNPMEFDSQKITSDLMEHTTLDQSQSNALVSALTQEVCCIQGPPGT